MTALREIKLLRELHNPRLVQLLDVFSHKANLYLARPRRQGRPARMLGPPRTPTPRVQVFEYCESDLERLIKDRRTLLSQGDVKAYMHMVLTALQFCHQNWVLHRDVKPNNFLVTRAGGGRAGRVLLCWVGRTQPLTWRPGGQGTSSWATLAWRASTAAPTGA